MARNIVWEVLSRYSRVCSARLAFRRRTLDSQAKMRSFQPRRKNTKLKSRAVVLVCTFVVSGPNGEGRWRRKRGKRAENIIVPSPLHQPVN